MPVISLTVSENAFSASEKQTIAAGLTDAMVAAAAAAGKSDIRPEFTVHIMETAADGYAIGGKVVG